MLSGFSGTPLSGALLRDRVSAGVRMSPVRAAHSSIAGAPALSKRLCVRFFPRGGKLKRNALLRCNSVRSCLDRWSMCKDQRSVPRGGESELFAFRHRGNFTGLRPPDSIGRSCIPILKKNLHVAVPESASTWYPAETDARLRRPHFWDLLCLSED